MSLPNFPPHAQSAAPRVLMMAAGTGGHIFPALAVADELHRRGADIVWLGTLAGMENRLVGDKYPLEAVAMQGLRGKGLGRMLCMPFMLARAICQALFVLKKQHIDIVVGFGGYVTVAGALAGKLAGKPLIIHEQNAIAGLSNRRLAPYANQVLQAFDGAFGQMNVQALTVGNPLRRTLNARSGDAPLPSDNDFVRSTPLKLLVLGGSLGAQAINRAVVDMLGQISRPLSVCHQCGADNLQQVQAWYSAAAIDESRYRLTSFIDDMNAAYAWADLVLCRAGALTVSEIASVGVAAIFVPLPHAVDDHQSANAKTLTDNQAAILLPQSALNGKSLTQLLENMTWQDCQQLAHNAKTHAIPHATERVADCIWTFVDSSGRSR